MRTCLEDGTVRWRLYNLWVTRPTYLASVCCSVSFALESIKELSSSTDEEDARLFLLSSPPWKIEEIASFANYAFERYRTLVIGKELRKDFVPFSQINNAILESTPSGITFCDLPIKGYCDHFLSLGPNFFYEMLSTSEPDKRRCLLIQDADDHELQSLEMLLAWSSRTPDSGPQDPEDIELESQGLQFRGDDFQTSPNAGWVLV